MPVKEKKAHPPVHVELTQAEILWVMLRLEKLKGARNSSEERLLKKVREAYRGA